MNNNTNRNYYLDDIPIEIALEKYFNSLKNYLSVIDHEEIQVTNSNNKITYEPVFAKISSPNFNFLALILCIV